LGAYPVPQGQFTAVSCGSAYGLALRTDGTLAAWGDNQFGNLNVPSGTFRAIGTGTFATSFAVRSDGTDSNMTDSRGTNSFSHRSVLRNGAPVLIRVALPEDRDKVVAAFNKLEPDSIYTRFFGMRKQLSPAELDRITASDFVTFVSLAAIVGSGPDEVLIGGASYVVLPSADGARVAEVAFTIEEDYHGQGLAGKLLGGLVGLARQNGIVRFEADVLAGNAAMLSVFERSGLPLTKAREGGVIHVVMDLRLDQGTRQETQA
jgi:RimJ/RimL family protein N-acetyltransferase